VFLSNCVVNNDENTFQQKDKIKNIINEKCEKQIQKMNNEKIFF